MKEMPDTTFGYIPPVRDDLFTPIYEEYAKEHRLRPFLTGIAATLIFSMGIATFLSLHRPSTFSEHRGHIEEEIVLIHTFFSNEYNYFTDPFTEEP
ncbi:hypothetical protein [Chitinivibrio alkaliphilus]|uniref:Uncharacterized protein n=1 Tax=Chitinivibrio alkaliphilus ACht1 TaxID=1313304 RepID=U7D943_9BACT|nr:hypothetical protein [Chitinivibrio alkaliphilus]ERP38909.1 hypothetical protein CALK_0396 [Chitinivibrio alkaliphilus ACht1]